VDDFHEAKTTLNVCQKIHVNLFLFIYIIQFWALQVYTVLLRPTLHFTIHHTTSRIVLQGEMTAILLRRPPPPPPQLTGARSVL
jgi:hypothetical protein